MGQLTFYDTYCYGTEAFLMSLVVGLVCFPGGLRRRNHLGIHAAGPGLYAQ